MDTKALARAIAAAHPNARDPEDSHGIREMVNGHAAGLRPFQVNLLTILVAKIISDRAGGNK